MACAPSHLRAAAEETLIFHPPPSPRAGTKYPVRANPSLRRNVLIAGFLRFLLILIFWIYRKFTGSGKYFRALAKPLPEIIGFPVTSSALGEVDLPEITGSSKYFRASVKPFSFPVTGSALGKLGTGFGSIQQSLGETHGIQYMLEL